MAKGAAVNGVLAVAANSIVTAQPAAGVEWLITTASTAGDAVNSGKIGLYDGSNYSWGLAQLDYGIGEGDLTRNCFRDGKIFVNNTTYLAIENQRDSSIYAGYSGIQWK